jgi:predicted RNase H-like nuclease (RuvC/YqgF family)
MDDSILVALAALAGGLGIKEIWAIVKQKGTFRAKKEEREENVYKERIDLLVEKILALEKKIDELIEENIALKVKIAKMEERLILNAKNKASRKRS